MIGQKKYGVEYGVLFRTIKSKKFKRQTQKTKRKKEKDRCVPKRISWSPRM